MMDRYYDPPDDGPDYDFVKHSLRTARKDHACGICKKRIRKGERHHYETWKDETGFHASRSHHECPPTSMREAQEDFAYQWQGGEGPTLESFLKYCRFETAAEVQEFTRFAITVFERMHR